MIITYFYSLNKYAAKNTCFISPVAFLLSPSPFYYQSTNYRSILQSICLVSNIRAFLFLCPPHFSCTSRVLPFSSCTHFHVPWRSVIWPCTGIRSPIIDRQAMICDQTTESTFYLIPRCYLSFPAIVIDSTAHDEGTEDGLKKIFWEIKAGIFFKILGRPF